MACTAYKALRVILGFYTIWNLILWPLPSTLWDRLLSSSVVATVGVYLTYVHPREIILDCPDMVVRGARLRAADGLLHLLPFASAWALTLGGAFRCPTQTATVVTMGVLVAYLGVVDLSRKYRTSSSAMFSIAAATVVAYLFLRP
jgi:hypothetical protein